MTIQQIRKVHQSEPFRPFYLQLADGRRILVSYRENLGYSVKGRILSVFESQDAGELIDLSDVTGVKEYHPQRNGAKHK